MVCAVCKENQHLNCLELLRQNHWYAGGKATGIALLGSQWCDCQHQSRKVSADT